jgi:ribosomal protein L29
MTLTLHQMVAEKKRQDATNKKNEQAKLRIQELSGHSSKTSSFMNVKEELKGTIKAVSSILDPKYSEEEFNDLVSHHDIPITNDLMYMYSHFLTNLDPTKKRMFNRFLEILLMKKHNTLLKQIEKKGKPTVMFHEEQQLELILKNEINKSKQRVI